MKVMDKNFLGKYDTIIFDMDGVITSEQNYWNSAACTVYEYFNRTASKNISVDFVMKNIESIRKNIFYNDKIIKALKSKGVNSNWDLGYVVVCISLIINSQNPLNIYNYIKTMSQNILDEYDILAQKTAQRLGEKIEYTNRSGQIWERLHLSFQEWFLGDKLFLDIYNRYPYLSNKPGFVNKEYPIVDLERLKKMLIKLSASRRLCIGTGRPSAEIMGPLENWDCLRYFDFDGIITYDFVLEAEKRLGLNALTKPHPYMFLKAMCGKDYDDAKIIDGFYDKTQLKKVLVVGDAGSDIMAAKAMGVDFCAVLTGISGQKAREYFENSGAEYILNNVLELEMYI